MSAICQVTGRKTVAGNNVSHANNKTRRQFKPNLRSKRFWLAEEKRWVRLRVSTAAIRTINKVGIEKVLREMSPAK
ncbi:MAG: 50S ribosomal protein L28 [Acidobacteria bacterium]|nr:50S ribosomal protein L28 [Acidobacteriota bacterium]